MRQIPPPLDSSTIRHSIEQRPALWPWSSPSLPVDEVDRDLPLITVITPSFNQGRFIEETLRSVLLQDYPNIEYRVYDGGSTDNSVSILRYYSDYLTHWESCADEGQADAINKGIRESEGEIFCWLNSDDFFLPGTLRKIGELYRANGEQIIVGNAIFFVEGTNLKWGCSSKEVTFDNMLNVWTGKMSWVQPATFVSRSLIQQAGEIDSTFTYTFDQEWMCRLLKLSQVYYLSEELVSFRFHADSKTVGQANAWLDEYLRVVERHSSTLSNVAVRRITAGYMIYAGAMPRMSVIRNSFNRREAVSFMWKAMRKDVGIVCERQFWCCLAAILSPRSFLVFIRKRSLL